MSAFRSAEPSPHGMQRGPSSMHGVAPGCAFLPTTISSLQHHISSLAPTHDVAETIQESACISSAILADNFGRTAAPGATFSHLCGAGSAAAHAAGNAETSHASSRLQSGMLLSTVLHGATLGHDDVQVASAPDASSKSVEPHTLHSPVQHAAQHGTVACKADGATRSQAAHVQPCSSVLQNLNLFDEAEHCRHRQATKAAKRAYMSQKQQRVWEAKSQAGNLETLPTWLRAESHP